MARAVRTVLLDGVGCIEAKVYFLSNFDANIALKPEPGITTLVLNGPWATSLFIIQLI